LIIFVAQNEKHISDISVNVGLLSSVRGETYLL